MNRRIACMHFLTFFLAFLTTESAYPQPTATDQPSTTAKVTYEREEFGLKLEYPSFFVPLQAPSPQVLLLLRPPSGRYPSFNILLQGGNPDVEKKTVEQLEADVVDSYRSVGLIDAEARFGEKRRFADRTVFFAKIFYEQNKIALTSGVYVVPTREGYFICTLISDRDHFNDHEPYLTELMKTLSISAPPPMELKHDEPKATFFWLSVFLAFLLVAKFMLLILRKLGVSQQ